MEDKKAIIEVTHVDGNVTYTMTVRAREYFHKVLGNVAVRYQRPGLWAGIRGGFYRKSVNESVAADRFAGDLVIAEGGQFNDDPDYRTTLVDKLEEIKLGFPREIWDIMWAGAKTGLQEQGMIPKEGSSVSSA